MLIRKKLFPLGFLMPILFSKISKSQKWTKKRPLLVSKSMKKCSTTFLFENWTYIFWGPDSDSVFNIFRNPKINSKTPFCTKKWEKSSNYFLSENWPYIFWGFSWNILTTEPIKLLMCPPRSFITLCRIFFKVSPWVRYTRC